MCCLWALLGDISNNDLVGNLRAFHSMQSRGPDASRIELGENHIIGFHRLAINDLSFDGQQPFISKYEDENYLLVCNGEIYNSDALQKRYALETKSSSDCAIILPLFHYLKNDFISLNQQLQGEYSFLIVKLPSQTHKSQLQFWASTDPLSVRPLFMCVSEFNSLGFSSLLQGLTGLKGEVSRIPQGSFVQGSYDGVQITCTHGKYTPHFSYSPDCSSYAYNVETVELYRKIVDTLERCVAKRMKSDVPIGALLSGGLDSSLVAAIAARILAEQGKRLKTFCIGMEGSTDMIYANKVAQYINSDHTNIYFNTKEGISVVPEVLKATESFDITTIRASVGQFLVSKYIRKNTDVRVLLNGDGADECQMGYLYFHFAPNDEEAQIESLRLITNIHLYDGLRVDRCISYHGLEARVPFLDRDFVELFVNIHPHLKRPFGRERIEKYLIRKAFEVIYEDEPIIPNEVLWRQKEAFSDGVSSKSKSWFLELKQNLEEQISEEPLTRKWKHISPPTKEALYYRYVFDSLFGERSAIVIPKYWLPAWIDTTEPSARTLSVYNNDDEE
jgi:asparagine synthase (glutamine-hydrolysing)